ncbi:TrkH family potassium uptake protein [Stappia sp.]|uniref:TrkH family potassium uptake protein n=1 Tax=Stappia sp. TaxID=1870903 RepID=UPI0032D8C405
MDFRAVAQPIGWLMIVIAVFMLLPAAVDLSAGNADWSGFVLSAALVGCTGATMALAFSAPSNVMRRREIFLFVNLAWVVSGLCAALPMMFGAARMSVSDAVFEAVSGLTTTGATVLTGLDTLPVGLLLWRSLLQWMGGIGIVVLGIWLLPGLRSGGAQLFAVESSETATKPYGRIEPFLMRLLVLYVGLTAAAGLLYRLGGMDAFQALNHALTTVSTGGYSTSDRSFGQFTALPLYWVAIVFMTLSSLPFLFLIRFVERGERRDLPQIAFFLGLVACASLAAFTVLHLHASADPWRELTLAVFHVVSVVSTTGYASEDYLRWGPFALTLFFLLTFFGGCSGSTSGGFKAFRAVALLRLIRTRVQLLIRPHRACAARYDGRRLTPDVAEGIFVFAIVYVGTFALFALVYAGAGLDLETALSASITALANVGPGVGAIIGPAGTFQSLGDATKLLLAYEMILGRLEILAGLLVLLPEFWTGD